MYRTSIVHCKYLACTIWRKLVFQQAGLDLNVTIHRDICMACRDVLDLTKAAFRQKRYTEYTAHCSTFTVHVFMNTFVYSIY